MKPRYRYLALFLVCLVFLSLFSPVVMADDEPDPEAPAEETSEALPEGSPEKSGDEPTEEIPNELTEEMPLAVSSPMLAAKVSTAFITFDYVYDSNWNAVYYQHPFYYNGGPTGGYGDQRLNDYANGQEAYCIEPGVMLAYADELRSDVTDVWNSFSAEKKNAIKLALLCGRAGNASNLPGSATCQHTATQMVIWEFVIGARSTTPPYTRTNDEVYTCLVSNGQNAEIGRIYDTIISYMLSYMTLPSFMTTSTETMSMQELTKSGSSYKLTLTDSNNVLGNYSFTSSDAAVSVSQNGNVLTLSANTPVSSNVTITATRNSAYTASSTFTPYGSTTRQDIVVGVEAVGGLTGYVGIKPSLGNLQIVKTSDDNVISDITFTVTGNGVNKTVKTDTQGKILVSDLQAGTYTVTETVPQEYVNANSAQSVTVNAGATATVSFANVRKQFRVTVAKEDAVTRTAQGDGKLSGAVYGLYWGTELIEKCTTDKNGKFTSGWYYCGEGWTIKEITASTGYLPDSTVYSIPASASQLSLAQTELSLTVKETPIMGQISLSKKAVNSITGEAASEQGATFEVYLKSAGSYANAKATERDTLVCGVDGMAISKMLPYGVYIVRQLSGWEGYTLDTALHEIEISIDGVVMPIHLTNEVFKGTLTVVKTDKDSGEPLEGASFRVLNDKGGEYAKGTTDDKGKLVFENIPYGSYYLEEQEAPEFYSPDNTPYVFSVTTDKQEITVERVNTRIPGSITITKTDSGDNPIPGAVFLVEYSEDGENWKPIFQSEIPAKEIGGCTAESLNNGSLATDETGTAVFTGLRADKTVHYRLLEISTANGCVLLTEPVELGTLPREDGEYLLYDISVTVTNCPTYILPMTGSSGLRPVLCGAIAMMSMGLFFILKSKKHPKENNTQ